MNIRSPPTRMRSTAIPLKWQVRFLSNLPVLASFRASNSLTGTPATLSDASIVVWRSKTTQNRSQFRCPPFFHEPRVAASLNCSPQSYTYFQKIAFFHSVFVVGTLKRLPGVCCAIYRALRLLNLWRGHFLTVTSLSYPFTNHTTNRHIPLL